MCLLPLPLHLHLAPVEWPQALTDFRIHLKLERSLSDRTVEAYVRETRDAVQGKREVRDAEFFEQTRQFVDKAQETRKNLERDVRDSIADAMKESSASRPRDAADAERMIRRVSRARENAGTTQRPPGMDQIASRAVNLLQ